MADLGTIPAQRAQRTNSIMPIPDYQALMLPVLRLAAKGEQRVADVADRVANEFGLGEEERENPTPERSAASAEQPYPPSSICPRRG